MEPTGALGLAGFAATAASLLFAVSGLLLLLRARRAASRVMLTAIAAIVAPLLLPAAYNLLWTTPLWARIALGLVLGLLGLQFLLRGVFGRSVANGVVSGIILDMLRGPMRLIGSALRKYLRGF